MQDFGFYLVITNPVLGYERCCEEAVKANVKIVQLRMKDAPREEIVAVAKAMRRITRGTDTLFIVNDDPSIAAEVEADGVHVGQSDMRPTEIRRLYPSIKIIGLSTHGPDQARSAVRDGADYIGVGPIYATQTKEDVCAPVGLGYLDWVVSNITLPFVAIGGIKEHNIGEVAAPGARCCALVSELVGAEDISAKVLSVRAAMKA